MLQSMLKYPSLPLPSNRVQRRRSQRNTGQRKRYVDDLHLSLSDEELQEEVMNPLPRCKKDYQGYEEEDSEYEHGAGGGQQAFTRSSSKHRTKTVCINPTEGFQYSDMYFEPPAEEANVVERILAQRYREPTDEEEEEEEGGAESVEEFLVKFKNYSYLHSKWATFEKILSGDKRFDGKVKRFKQKQAAQGIFANLDDEPFNPEYTMVERILDVASQTEPSGEVVTHYLVKWRSLPYEDATWELEEDVNQEAVRQFNKLHLPPPSEELAVSCFCADTCT